MLYFCSAKHNCSVLQQYVNCCLSANQVMHKSKESRNIHYCPFGCEFYTNGVIIKDG
jgi:hypothetical protein